MQNDEQSHQKLHRFHTEFFIKSLKYIYHSPMQNDDINRQNASGK